jgi:hypothetical protein
MTDLLNTYKDTFPLLTFSLGYLLNAIINILDTKRHTKNVKKVLIHEIKHNLDMLELAVKNTPKSDSDGERLFNRAKIISRASESMTNNVYHALIADIAKMKDLDINNFLNFHSALVTLQRYSSDLIDYVNTEERTDSENKKMIARAMAIANLADAMLNNRTLFK